MEKATLISYEIKRKLRRVLNRQSFLFLLGWLSGYFFAYIFSGRHTSQPGIIDLDVFDFGRWQVHIHHWLLSAIILFFLVFPLFIKKKISLKLFLFVLGLSLGLIVQGIFSYSDWYKIISLRVA